MPQPFLSRFFPTTPAEGQAERLIDNEYQLARFAVDSAGAGSQLDYLETLQDTQRNQAIQRVQQHAATESKGGAFHSLLRLLNASQPYGTAAFAPGNISSQELQAVKARLEEQGQAIEMALQEQLLASTTDPGVSKLQTEAARALKNGMSSTGRDQQEEFKDALQLFREAQEGAIGSRNYVVWFQIGWILWKLEGDLAAAEEAFYQAYRLSASQGDIFYYLSLRHRAYLQYLQGRPEEAWGTIERAITAFDKDIETLRMLPGMLPQPEYGGSALSSGATAFLRALNRNDSICR